MDSNDDPISTTKGDFIMSQPITKKRGPKAHKPLKEDIYTHLDSIYRSARRCKNFPVALKAIEMCLKAKKAALKQNPSLLNLNDLSEEELELIVQTLVQEE